jgi:hypothetical protein
MNEPHKKPEAGTEPAAPQPDEQPKPDTAASDADISQSGNTQAAPAQAAATPNPADAATPAQAATPPAEGTVTAAYVSSDDETAAPAAKTSIGKIIAFGIVALVFLAAALFFLERNGTLSTGIFDAYFEQQAAAAVIATVNGEEIIGRDLTTSMDQFSEAAIAQGVDVSNPEFKEMVRERSLEVLINTELLKQEAAERGIVATEEEIVTRIESVEAQLGGAAVLDERIAELGIDRDRLREDISDEIVIQALLEEIFTEAEITITDEDVEALYEEAGGAEAGLPALEEVRPQVEAQIQAAREQEAIDTFLETLRSDADIQIQE